MINLSTEIASWAIDEDGWSISPGVEWCTKGHRVRVGVQCTAGDYFTADDYFAVGDHFKAGDHFKSGDCFKSGNYFTAGDCFTAGDRATGIACLGFADWYWKSLSAVDGVAYIGAGCRWFTLAEAIRHWTNHEEDRRATMALMQAAKALAELHNLRHSHY